MKISRHRLVLEKTETSELVSQPNREGLSLIQMIRGSMSLAKNYIYRNIRSLTQRHEALRLRLTDLGNDERQTLLVDSEIPPLGVVDLSGTPSSESARRLEQEITAMQSSLDIELGPICRVAVIRGLDGDSNCLVWVVHHLAVDVYSWRVLIDDLESIYARLCGDQPAGDRAK